MPIFKIEKEMEEIIPVTELLDHSFVKKTGEEIVVFKVEPINFKLKSAAEQNSILEAYQTFLKQCDFDMQIYIQTGKANAKKHMDEVRKCILYEPQVAALAEDYLVFLREISEVRGSISRRFFVVLKIGAHDGETKKNRIVEGLESCGNHVEICSKKELLQIFEVCFKKVQSYVAQ